MNNNFRIFNMFICASIVCSIGIIVVETNVVLNNTAQTLPKFTYDAPHDHTCLKNQPFVWCIPKGYNTAEEPWRYRYITNATFPWIYHFKFYIIDVQEVNDQKQTVSISMYFVIAWLEPRLKINSSAADWNDTKFGSPDEVNVSPEVLKHLWIPDLEIIGMDAFVSKNILKEMSSIQINKNRLVKYEGRADITISCQMNFDHYPLDTHQCPFRIGSYYSTEETVQCTDEYEFDTNRQRSLQYFIEIDSLPEKDHTIIWDSKQYAVCGVNIALKRARMQIFSQVYLTSMVFVVVSWASFLIKPDLVAGRMGVLVTLFLVLINIFNSVKSNAPVSVKLNAVDLYLVICIGQVFLALTEYAAVLFGERYRRSPTASVRATKNLGFSAVPNNNLGTNLASHEQHPSWNKLDSASLCIFPLVFIISNIIYCIIYI